MTKKNGNKVAIVGLGAVGATCAYTLLLSGLVQDLILIDINTKKAEGEALDLQHSIPLLSAAQVRAGDYSDCTDADIVIVTAGAPQTNAQTRMDLLERNAKILADIVPQVVRYAPDCVLLIVTNPVDILTYLAQAWSGLPRNKVIGSGTVLDTSRLKTLLADHTGIDGRNIHTYVLGEHGDTEFAAWSLTSIAGLSIQNYCRQCASCKNSLPEQMEKTFRKEVRNAAYRVIEYKGATFYAVSVAVRRICEAILRDEKSLLTVSSFVEGVCSLPDVCLSLPCVLGENGVEKILQPPLTDAERQTLQRSGLILQQAMQAYL